MEPPPDSAVTPKACAFTRFVPIFEAEPWRLALIPAHAASVERRGRYLERLFPHEDMTPLCFDALYRAAATWRPGKAGFHLWLRRCIWQQTSAVSRRYQRHDRGLKNSGPAPAGQSPTQTPPIHLHWLSAETVNRYYCYHDPEPDWVDIRSTSMPKCGPARN